jgi:hypothetical protein
MTTELTDEQRAGDAVREALAELVELDDLARAAARLFATLNTPSSKDSDYEVYGEMTGELARRRPLALKAARAALAAPQAPDPAAPPVALVFTLPEADALLRFFGGEPGEVTVRELPRGVIADCEGPSPAGLWAHMTEYPEEGSAFLGPADDPDAPISQPAAESPAAPVALTEKIIADLLDWVATFPHNAPLALVCRAAADRLQSLAAADVLLREVAADLKRHGAVRESIENDVLTYAAAPASPAPAVPPVEGHTDECRLYTTPRPGQGYRKCICAAIPAPAAGRSET